MDHVVEPQGGHGQVVAGEAQGGNADDQRHQRHGRGGEQHGGPGRQVVGGGEDGGAVSPQAEEGGVPQGDLAGVADEEVEPQDGDDIEADEVENPQVIRIVDHQRA